MSSSLNSSELSFYKKEGFIVIENLFSYKEIHIIKESIQISIENLLTNITSGKTYFLDQKRFVDLDNQTIQFEPKPHGDKIKVIEPAHCLNKELLKLVHDIRITDPIKSILGTSKISLWTDKLNLKTPKSGSSFGWHQDSPYWVHDNEDVNRLPNAYLSLDDSNEKNGCFRVIRRSHTKGCLEGKDDGSQLGGFYTNPKCFDLADEVSFDLSTGSIVFFDPHIVHGSRENNSLKQRMAYIMTYQPGYRSMLKENKVEKI